MDETIQAAAARLVRRLKEGNHTLTLAESCTGGLLASTLTDIAGASTWFKKSWVTYANEAKVNELGVDPEELASKGAVSAQVAIMMAKGALKRAEANFAISVTGIAGPTNEGSKKPVGTVYVGIASHTGWANAIRTQIGGTRAENKAGFVYFALLTAMQCWDDAMRRRKQDEQDLLDAAAEALRLEEEREAERVRRDQEAREQAPWQDEAWSEESEGEEIGLEVEWTDGEE
ncbi:MAG: CinA family protein [Candidatus Thermoplasmatota archaeon]|nr:CinA family protein [Candidatus Thermoplasmatota archaeon]MEC8680764.1 CinA family protein [Candidatus Thermoplasmatota archaeon]